MSYRQPTPFTHFFLYEVTHGFLSIIIIIKCANSSTSIIYSAAQPSVETLFPLPPKKKQKFPSLSPRLPCLAALIRSFYANDPYLMDGCCSHLIYSLTDGDKEVSPVLSTRDGD